MSKKTWGQLEYQAMSERPEDRVDAVVKSHAKVGDILRDMHWSDELRNAIETIRVPVVHSEYDPTVQEALRAVRTFFQLWQEKIEPFDKEKHPAPHTVDDLHHAAELYEQGAEWIPGGTPDTLPIEEWGVSVGRAACSLDVKERTEAVKDAYSAVKEMLGRRHVPIHPKRNFEKALNEACSKIGCEMRCGNMMRWAYSLGKCVVGEKRYKPSLPEAHRAVQIFKEIFYLLSITDYSPDTSVEDLYGQNFAKIYTDTEPKYPDLIGHELNINQEAVIDLADQLGITFDVFTGLIKADEALLICQSFKNGLLKSRVKTERVTIGTILKNRQNSPPLNEEKGRGYLPSREEPEEENPFAAADRELETRRRVIIRRRG